MYVLVATTSGLPGEAQKIDRILEAFSEANDSLSLLLFGSFVRLILLHYFID
jgi:hypothetical protein